MAIQDAGKIKRYDTKDDARPSEGAGGLSEKVAV